MCEFAQGGLAGTIIFVSETIITSTFSDMKTSFSFRRSWLDAINMINDAALRAEITAAVVNYGLTGELTPSDSDIVNATPERLSYHRFHANATRQNLR